MQIISANLNGIRAATRKGWLNLVEQSKPEIICLQETKAQMCANTLTECIPAGYHAYFSDATKKGYSGVGILSKSKPDTIKLYGNPIFDAEGRYLEAHFGDLIIISLYLPSGTSGSSRQAIKMQCLEDFYQNKLTKLVKKKVLIAGDFNIAHNEIDLKNWRTNQKNSGFLPEERAWFTKMLSLGWCDSFRTLYPEKTQYSWWTYRSNARSRDVGWRIDYQITSPAIELVAADVINEPIISDHAPISLIIKHQ